QLGKADPREGGLRVDADVLLVSLPGTRSHAQTNLLQPIIEVGADVQPLRRGGGALLDSSLDRSQLPPHFLSRLAVDVLALASAVHPADGDRATPSPVGRSVDRPF